MADEQKPQEEKKEEQKKEVPEKFKGLIEQIEGLSALELAELVKVLEDKFGVTAQAPMIAAAPGAAAGEAGAEEEKSSFNIEITAAGSNKIAVIKAVREVTEIGLKEAKDMVEAAPKVIKEDVPKKDAEELKKKLEEAGAQVTLK